MPPPLEIGPLVIDPPLLQAPMAGFTNYAFRHVVRRFGGVGLPATEMFCAGGFWRLIRATIDRRSGSGACWKSLARWPRKSGTITRT